MKSASVISSNFLERIADSESQFYPDYQSYLKGKITKQELVARLPHVAMLGDSACMGTYISSPWSTFWRTCTANLKACSPTWRSSSSQCSTAIDTLTSAPALWPR